MYCDDHDLRSAGITFSLVPFDASMLKIEYIIEKILPLFVFVISLSVLLLIDRRRKGLRCRLLDRLLSRRVIGMRTLDDLIQFTAVQPNSAAF